MDRIPLHEALADRDRVLRTFLDDGGRLVSMPAKHRKRLVVLDHIARVFEPSRRFTEVEVNAMVRAFHDVAMVRRYLADSEFLSRADGVYWRTGGSVE